MGIGEADLGAVLCGGGQDNVRRGIRKGHGEMGAEGVSGMVVVSRWPHDVKKVMRGGWRCRIEGQDDSNWWWCSMAVFWMVDEAASIWRHVLQERGVSVAGA